MKAKGWEASRWVLHVKMANFNNTFLEVLSDRPITFIPFPPKIILKIQVIRKYLCFKNQPYLSIFHAILTGSGGFES